MRLGKQLLALLTIGIALLVLIPTPFVQKAASPGDPTADFEIRSRLISIDCCAQKCPDHVYQTSSFRVPTVDSYVGVQVDMWVHSSFVYPNTCNPQSKWMVMYTGGQGSHWVLNNMYPYVFTSASWTTQLPAWSQVAVGSSWSSADTRCGHVDGTAGGPGSTYQTLYGRDDFWAFCQNPVPIVVTGFKSATWNYVHFGQAYNVVLTLTDTNPDSDSYSYTAPMTA